MWPALPTLGCPQRYTTVSFPLTWSLFRSSPPGEFSYVYCMKWEQAGPLHVVNKHLVRHDQNLPKGEHHPLPEATSCVTHSSRGTTGPQESRVRMSLREQAPRKPKHHTDAADGPQDTYLNLELACWVNMEHLLLLEIGCLGQGPARYTPIVILVDNSASLSLSLSPIIQE